MPITKIYLSHSDNQKGIELSEEVKKILTKEKKKVFTFDSKSRSKKQFENLWDKTKEEISTSQLSIFVLTEDLLKGNQEQLAKNGSMYKEISRSLEFGFHKLINGVIMIVDKEFKRKYFSTIINTPTFPIIDKNIDNINSFLKNRNSSLDYIIILTIDEFKENYKFWLRETYNNRMKQMSKRIYDINFDA